MGAPAMQAQRDALRAAALRRPSVHESRSERMLRRYLGAALYAALRANRPPKDRRGQA